MMIALNPDIAWLSNPEVFAVSRKQPYSDHMRYATIADTEAWKPCEVFHNESLKNKAVIVHQTSRRRSGNRQIPEV